MMLLLRPCIHFCLCSILLFSPLRSPQTVSSDPAPVNLLIQRYFAAYTAKDLDGIMACWSSHSPDFAVRKEKAQNLFDLVDQVRIDKLTVRSIHRENNSAIAMVGFDMALHGKDNADPVHVPHHWTMHLILEPQGWEIEREGASEVDVADALVSAKSEAERTEVLVTAKELVDQRLREEMMRIAGREAERGRTVRARELYELARTVSARLGDRDGDGQALLSIGITFAQQNDFTQAMEFYQKAHGILVEAGDLLNVCSADTDMAEVYLSREDFRKAREQADSAVKEAETLRDRASGKAQKKEALECIANSYINLGNAFYHLGSLNEALKAMQSSFDAATTLKDHSLIGRALLNIGGTYCALGDYDNAEDTYKKLLTVMDPWILPAKSTFTDREIMARMHNNLANLRFAQGNYMEALDLYRSAIEESRELNMQVLRADALGNIANIYQYQGDYPQAIAFHNQALEIYRRRQSREGIANSLTGLGVIATIQRDYHHALECDVEAAKIFEALHNSSSESAALLNSSYVRFLMRDYAEAIKGYERCLALIKQSEDPERTLQIFAARAQAYLALGQPRLAGEDAGRAVALAQQMHQPEYYWRALCLQGLSDRALGRLDAARGEWEQAIGIIEKLRLEVAGGDQQRQQFFENKTTPYVALFDLLMSQGYAAQALSCAERAKGRVLSEALRLGRLDIDHEMTSEEKAKEQRLNRVLAACNHQLFVASQSGVNDSKYRKQVAGRQEVARSAYSAFLTELYATHPNLSRQRGDVPPFSLDQARPLIPEHGAILEFVVVENKTYLFVLSSKRNGTDAVDLKVYPIVITREELGRLVEDFRDRTSDDKHVYIPQAQELYRRLLTPAAAQLKTCSKLVIIPDGPLWELPFQALRTENERFLIEEHSLSYVHSLAVLREMQRLRIRKEGGSAPKPSVDFLVFANPVLGKSAAHAAAARRGGALGPLPHAEEEAHQIARLYGTDHSRVYVAGDATEDRLKAEAATCRVLQLSTHGILEDKRPLYSYLVLSQKSESIASGEDGLLEAREIMRLDLSRVDLVVLSACETARGQVGEGEGMIGMSWALFLAGCSTAVVSQWQVDSAATTPLMIAFHKNLRSGGLHGAPLAPPEAMRAAVQAHMGTPGHFLHPFYWAGFVVLGDGR